MAVLGGSAVSYEQGTPVLEDMDTQRHDGGGPMFQRRTLPQDPTAVCGSALTPCRTLAPPAVFPACIPVQTMNTQTALACPCPCVALHLRARFNNRVPLSARGAPAPSHPPPCSSFSASPAVHRLQPDLPPDEFDSSSHKTAELFDTRRKVLATAARQRAKITRIGTKAHLLGSKSCIIVSVGGRSCLAK